MNLQRNSVTGNLLVLPNGNLAGACCCDRYDCSENLAYYSLFAQVTFASLAGCLADLNGDNELEATSSNLIDEEPGANWYQKDKDVDADWLQEPCRWGWLDSGSGLSIDLHLFHNIVTLEERWYLRAQANISGGYVGKWWYKAHTDGSESDLYGAYTESHCTFSGTCDCAGSAGATAEVSEI